MSRPLFLAVGVLSLFLISGCGSKSKNKVPLPASFSASRFQPNYGGDLDAANYFPNATITYRIVSPDNATDIRLNKISAVSPSTTQAQDIRDAFSKWQAALAGNDEANRRNIVEVSSSATADIDIVVQTKDQFRISFFNEEFAFTDFYLTDVDKGLLGRSVVRLRNDLEEREFRYVALHEVGHALGIDGHSRRSSTVMFSYQFPVIPTVELTNYDTNTIRAAYTR